MPTDSLAEGSDPRVDPRVATEGKAPNAVAEDNALHALEFRAISTPRLKTASKLDEFALEMLLAQHDDKDASR